MNSPKPISIVNQLYDDKIGKNPNISEEQRKRFLEMVHKQNLQRQKIIEEKNKQVAMPSWTEMAKNLGKSIIKNAQSVAAGNELKISEEDASARLNICKGCEFFNSEKERCGKCGCKMAVKTYLKAEKCPVGKW